MDFFMQFVLNYIVIVYLVVPFVVFMHELGYALESFLQFIMTIIPIKYPSFWRDYSGMESDGYQVMK